MSMFENYIGVCIYFYLFKLASRSYLALPVFMSQWLVRRISVINIPKILIEIGITLINNC